MNKVKEKTIEQYCFDLAVEIIGSDLQEANRVADILYREFENKIIKIII